MNHPVEKIFIAFPIYRLITRKQGMTVRQDNCKISFIGISPAHLTRESIEEVSLSYIPSSHSQQSLLISLKYLARRKLHHGASVIQLEYISLVSASCYVVFKDLEEYEYSSSLIQPMRRADFFIKQKKSKKIYRLSSSVCFFAHRQAVYRLFKSFEAVDGDIPIFLAASDSENPR